MPNKPWKETERRVARKLGGVRIALSGRSNMGKKGDVDLVGYLTEVKSGRQVPKTVVAWLETIRDLATDGEIPILVMQPKHLKERIVALTLTDFVRVMDRGGGGPGEPHVRAGQGDLASPPAAAPANPAAALMGELKREAMGLRTAHAISEARNQRAFQEAQQLRNRVLAYENSGLMDVDEHGHKIPRGYLKCVTGTVRP